MATQTLAARESLTPGPPLRLTERGWPKAAADGGRDG
jgi:hypothetical protein